MFYIGKIDKKTWDYLSDFINENYSNLSITIRRFNGLDVLESMELAYDLLCENIKQIESISIYADNENETIKVDFPIYKENNKFPRFVEVKCVGIERTNEIRAFLDAFSREIGISNWIMQTTSILFYFLLFHFYATSQLGYNLKDGPLVGLWGLLSVVFFVIHFKFVKPSIEKWMYGDMRIRLVLDEESIAEFEDLKKKALLKSAAVAVTMLMVMGSIFYMISRSW